jgi:hypothetical protein
MHVASPAGEGTRLVARLPGPVAAQTATTADAHTSAGRGARTVVESLGAV